MRKLLQSAVLFCVLLILFSGCGTTESEDQNLDHIRISNLRTTSMALTQEEQAYMNEICSILSASKLLRDESNNTIFSAQNTSQYNLNLSIHVNVFDEYGCLTQKSSMRIEGWKKDQKLFYSLFSQLAPEVETLTFIGQYNYNGIVYMTEPITLPITLGKEGPKTTLDYKSNLPTVVSLEQSWSQPVGYSLLDFSLEEGSSSTYHSLVLFMRKESGKDNNMDSIPIRIVDKDGHVHHTDYTHIYLNRGETARVVFDVPIYEPGEYYLELK